MDSSSIPKNRSKSKATTILLLILPSFILLPDSYRQSFPFFQSLVAIVPLIIILLLFATNSIKL